MLPPVKRILKIKSIRPYTPESITPVQTTVLTTVVTTIKSTLQKEKKEKKEKKIHPSLTQFYSDKTTYEICIDEAGRGPLFGRVYIASVVLPRDGSFLVDGIMDSKMIKSADKLRQLSERIKKEAVAWHIAYLEPGEIDNINILNATLNGMHECVRNICSQLEDNGKSMNSDNTLAVVDGNQFNPYCKWNEETQTIEWLPYVTVEHGDSLYVGVAAASILAKHAHDSYIWDLCDQYPELDAKYKLRSNVGYGTKHHLDGIREHGITRWHRKSFGPCKESVAKV